MLPIQQSGRGLLLTPKPLMLQKSKNPLFFPRGSAPRPPRPGPLYERTSPSGPEGVSPPGASTHIASSNGHAAVVFSHLVPALIVSPPLAGPALQRRVSHSPVMLDIPRITLPVRSSGWNPGHAARHRLQAVSHVTHGCR